MTVYFYGRCSDDEHFNKGSSIETQLEKCKSYAVLKDLTIDEEVTESISGTIRFERRTKGFELLKNLKNGGNLIFPKKYPAMIRGKINRNKIRSNCQPST